jgi:ubiquinone/menaquinone biosynthesis C-methylase UbiE
MDMNKETESTKEYYATKTQYEWNRLTQDAFHGLEYDTTWRFLHEHLPQKGLILDAGGGPGRYTIELAKKGYNVVLLDLAAENLELGKKEIDKAGVGERVKDIIVGTITDLSHFKDKSFDAVLCLGGPLSHVHPELERRKAVSELVRVARKNAPIFVSVMSKYGVLLATPAGWPQTVADKKYFNDLVATGNDYRFGHTAYCHFFTSAELEKAFSKQKVEVIEKVGLDGFNTDNKTTNAFAEKFPEAWKNWLEIHNQMCTDPFVVDASGHMMIIVRKN